MVAESSGRVVGSSFLDERGPIFAIGPVSVDPDAQDHHVGRKLMEAMLARFHERGAAGVRLVQIAYHNRSLSLYAKLGFEVRDSFAAMHGAPLQRVLPGLRRAPGHRRRRVRDELALPAGARPCAVGGGQ